MWKNTTSYLKGDTATTGDGKTWSAKVNNTNSAPTVGNTNWSFNMGGDGSVESIITVTQAEYDSMGTKNTKTLYVIVE